ncbi:MAG TPA: AAA family ATPase, partial [Pirellulales bacterium]|nr:AAA family ATPase [Pirellulales bacterium]
MSVTTLAPPESDRESHLAFDIRPFDDESSNFDQALLAGESESPGGAEVTAEVMPSETSADGDAEAWLHDALAVGGLIILAGGPSSGKGFVGCRLAAHVTKGEPGPFKLPYPAPSVPGDVLFITDRLTRRTLRKRLVAAGTDMDRVAPLPLAVHDSMDLKAIASELETRPDCKLLLIDPLPMTIGGTPAQMDDAYLLFRDLADLAARHRLALVAAVRLRQDRRDSKRDLDWLCGCGLGTVLALGRDRANSNRRFLLPARCVDDRDDLSIAFRVEEVPDAEAEAARVEWLVEPLATDTAKARAGMLRARESRRDAAGVWLVEAVSNGPVYVK